MSSWCCLLQILLGAAQSRGGHSADLEGPQKVLRLEAEVFLVQLWSEEGMPLLRSWLNISGPARKRTVESRSLKSLMCRYEWQCITGKVLVSKQHNTVCSFYGGKRDQDLFGQRVKGTPKSVATVCCAK